MGFGPDLSEAGPTVSVYENTWINKSTWTFLRPSGLLLAKNAENVFYQPSYRSRLATGLHGWEPLKGECKSDPGPPRSTWATRTTWLQPCHRGLRQCHSWPNGIFQKWVFRVMTFHILHRVKYYSNGKKVQTYVSVAGKCCFITTEFLLLVFLSHSLRHRPWPSRKPWAEGRQRAPRTQRRKGYKIVLTFHWNVREGWLRWEGWESLYVYRWSRTTRFTRVTRCIHCSDSTQSAEEGYR